MGPLTHTKAIPIDGYIKTLRIAVQPVTSKSDVALFYPNGTVLSFEEKHEQRELSRDMLTLLIKVNTCNSLRLLSCIALIF